MGRVKPFQWPGSSPALLCTNIPLAPPLPWEETCEETTPVTAGDSSAWDEDRQVPILPVVLLHARVSWHRLQEENLHVPVLTSLAMPQDWLGGSKGVPSPCIDQLIPSWEYPKGYPIPAWQSPKGHGFSSTNGESGQELPQAALLVCL